MTRLSWLLNKIIKTITEDIEKGVQSRVIFLRCGTTNALHRVKTRNRTGENIYTYENIQRIHDRYDEWFNE